MLRHIVSVSLAMTACATFIATKANAINFRLTSFYDLQRNPNDQIVFRLDLDPEGSGLGGVEIQRIYEPSPFNSENGTYDSNELSFSGIGPLTYLSRPLTSPSGIAAFVFRVINPIKDGQSDLMSVRVDYRANNQNWSVLVNNPAFNSSVLDVEPVQRNVPEPLTMFGAAAALGYGAILKRKSSKKTVS
jgi:hypothetical protein